VSLVASSAFPCLPCLADLHGSSQVQPRIVKVVEVFSDFLLGSSFVLSNFFLALELG
jgi:hypothetical protein